MTTDEITEARETIQKTAANLVARTGERYKELIREISKLQEERSKIYYEMGQSLHELSKAYAETIPVKEGTLIRALARISPERGRIEYKRGILVVVTHVSVDPLYTLGVAEGVETWRGFRVRYFGHRIANTGAISGKLTIVLPEDAEVVG